MATNHKQPHAISLSTMKPQASKLIEKAIGAEEWTSARRWIWAELRRHPKDHWLMSRLAITYYEQREYEKALNWDSMALQEAPYCPLPFGALPAHWTCWASVKKQSSLIDGC
jgi:hypothetical protein